MLLFFYILFFDILLRLIKVVESWRKEKLKEAKKMALGGEGLNSTRLQEEAGNS